MRQHASYFPRKNLWRGCRNNVEIVLTHRVRQPNEPARANQATKVISVRHTILSGRIHPNSDTRSHMKRCLIALGLLLLATPPAFAREQAVLARVTVYWASGGKGSDRWTRKHQTSTNVRLRAGHCAVDPRRIPYGSRVCLPDATLLAVDTGRHVVSRKAARKAGRTPLERNALVIDRFFETKRQALGWASTHPAFMTVRVLPPASRAVVSPTVGRAALATPLRAARPASRSTATARLTLPPSYVR